MIINEEETEIESTLQSTYQIISGHRNQLQITSDNDQERELLEVSIEIKDRLLDFRSAHRQDDWRATLESENKFYEIVKDYEAQGGHFPISDEELTESYAMNEELLDRDIPKEHDSYSIATPNYMMQVFNWLSTYGIFILLLVFLGSILTREYENRSARLLFTQPIKRINLIISKMAVSFFVFLISIVGILLFTFVISTFFGEEGSFNYPILIHTSDGIAFISIISYLTKSLLLVTVAFILFFSYYFLLSLLFKNTVMAMLALLISIILVNLINDILLDYISGWFNPFMNLFVHEAIVNQSTFLWYEGIFAAILLSSILIWLSKLLIKRQ
ncbi:ABC-type transport system involved in multi-copper enzyme maturation permease subunit [Alkalibacillus salilacus]|uniref:ABC-type transport system involved in multi-copper enzyme maturation permease subunit n=2 Tax=Alkalibacillus salilacus TaxID=284582 RepID=A0ABT9VIY0_9BACI|nr:ABC-type transport system involved in multi-copper enzyme maturation permease subunit [Alkalibacillus salilacus]